MVTYTSASFYRFLLFELVTFVDDFVPLAAEFGAFAIEFVALALQFVNLSIELDAFAIELGAFASEFVAFSPEFVITRMNSWNKAIATYLKSCCSDPKDPILPRNQFKEIK